MAAHDGSMCLIILNGGIKRQCVRFLASLYQSDCQE